MPTSSPDAPETIPTAEPALGAPASKGPPPVARTWDEILDQLDEYASGCRAALEGRVPVPVAPLLPGDLGPLPADLSSRAESALAEVLDLEVHCSDLRDRLAQFIWGEGQSATHRPDPPVYVDTSA